MGSSNNFLLTPKYGYILGLWGADGYHRTSSIGLTTIYPVLVKRFYHFLMEMFDLSRIRLRVYSNEGLKVSIPKELSWYIGDIHYSKGTKLRALAYQLYVNSRPLLREFNQAIVNRKRLSIQTIPTYFAGRFDGDGSVSSDRRKDFRITYKDSVEASIDKTLLEKIQVSKSRIYRYRDAGTYVIYVSRYESRALCKLLSLHSAKLSGLLVTP